MKRRASEEAEVQTAATRRQKSFNGVNRKPSSMKNISFRDESKLLWPGPSQRVSTDETQLAAWRIAACTR